MALTDGHFHLKPRPEDRSQYTPIDSFLTSLAEHAQSRAVGVILSGTASDGARGIREVKAAGGITFAQKPRHGEIRRHAARSDRDRDGRHRAVPARHRGQAHADCDASLCPRAGGAKRRRTQACATISSGAFSICFVRASGIDFRHYKLPTIKRRLLRRMALHRLTDVQHYIRLLEQTPDEIRALYQDLLIHVTRFFREPESFKALRRAGLPHDHRSSPRASSRSAPGSRVRDRRGGLFAGDLAARVSAAPRQLRPADSDLCHRRQRHGDRTRACGTLPGEHRGRRVARTSCAASSRKSMAATG